MHRQTTRIVSQHRGCVPCFGTRGADYDEISLGTPRSHATLGRSGRLTSTKIVYLHRCRVSDVCILFRTESSNGFCPKYCRVGHSTQVLRVQVRFCRLLIFPVHVCIRTLTAHVGASLKKEVISDYRVGRMKSFWTILMIVQTHYGPSVMIV